MFLLHLGAYLPLTNFGLVPYANLFLSCIWFNLQENHKYSRVCSSSSQTLKRPRSSSKRYQKQKQQNERSDDAQSLQRPCHKLQDPYRTNEHEKTCHYRKSCEEHFCSLFVVEESSFLVIALRIGGMSSEPRQTSTCHASEQAAERAVTLGIHVDEIIAAFQVAELLVVDGFRKGFGP